MAQGTTLKTKAATAAQPLKETPSVLVVDDDHQVVDFLLEYLRRSDLKVSSAFCGEDALDAIRQVSFDIALVDLKMSGMDGLETIEKITEIDPGIVTILMTGFPTLDSSIKAIRLGASDYILKPFKLDEVEVALGKAMHEREVRKEMTSLRRRVSELEKGISGKKEQIRINKKVTGLIASHGGKN
jgi:two-component system response regulator AtoC